MCGSSEDLRSRAGWDGVAGRSREQLLDDLQRASSSPLPSNRSLTRSSSRIHLARAHAATAASSSSPRASQVLPAAELRLPQRRCATIAPRRLPLRCELVPLPDDAHPHRPHRRDLASRVLAQRRMARNGWKGQDGDYLERQGVLLGSDSSRCRGLMRRRTTFRSRGSSAITPIRSRALPGRPTTPFSLLLLNRPSRCGTPKCARRLVPTKAADFLASRRDSSSTP